MARRQSRRQEERRAKADRRRSVEREPGWLTSRISTDWIVGSLIASVVIIAALVFGFRQIVSDGGSSVAFTQVFAVAADPANPELLLLGDVNGIFRSEDGGEDWDETPIEDEIRSIFSLGPSSFIAAGPSSFLRSADAGLTWQNVPNNLPSPDIRSITADPANSTAMYAFIGRQGLFRSNDGGQTWALAGEETRFAMLSLAVAPGNPETLFAFHTDRGLIKTVDGGASFEPVRGGIPFRNVASLLTVSGQPDTVLAVAQRDFWRSNDGGDTWTSSSSGLSEVTAAALTGRSADGEALLITDVFGFVYESTDGGNNWNPTGR